MKPVAGTCEGVQFLAGDCSSPESLFGAELLGSAPRPVLFIEDAHVNVGQVLAYIDRFLQSGDYLIVEDSYDKSDDLNAFLGQRPGRYAVDTRYTDFFGRNATSAINAILVKL